MFSHKVTIVRPDTSADFFYSALGILSNPQYISMVDVATQAGKLISETLTVSPDDLTFVREVIWDNETSFSDFFTEYNTNVFPDYTAEFSSYAATYNHQASLTTQTI